MRSSSVGWPIDSWMVSHRFDGAITRSYLPGSTGVAPSRCCACSVACAAASAKRLPRDAPRSRSAAAGIRLSVVLDSNCAALDVDGGDVERRLPAQEALLEEGALGVADRLLLAHPVERAAHLELRRALGRGHAARAAASSASTRSPSGTPNGSISNGELHLPTAFAVGASVTLRPRDSRWPWRWRRRRAPLRRRRRDRRARCRRSPTRRRRWRGCRRPSSRSRRRGRCDRLRAQRLLAHALEAHVGPRGAGRLGGVEPDGDERLEVVRGGGAAAAIARARARAAKLRRQPRRRQRRSLFGSASCRRSTNGARVEKSYARPMTGARRTPTSTSTDAAIRARRCRTPPPRSISATPTRWLHRRARRRGRRLHLVSAGAPPRRRPELLSTRLACVKHGAGSASAARSSAR